MHRLSTEPEFAKVKVFKVDFDSSKDLLRQWKVTAEHAHRVQGAGGETAVHRPDGARGPPQGLRSLALGGRAAWRVGFGRSGRVYAAMMPGAVEPRLS